MGNAARPWGAPQPRGAHRVLPVSCRYPGREKQPPKLSPGHPTASLGHPTASPALLPKSILRKSHPQAATSFVKGLMLMEEGKKPKANPSGEGSVVSPGWYYPPRIPPAPSAVLQGLGRGHRGCQTLCSASSTSWPQASKTTPPFAAGSVTSISCNGAARAPTRCQGHPGERLATRSPKQRHCLSGTAPS